MYFAICSVRGLSARNPHIPRKANENILNVHKTSKAFPYFKKWNKHGIRPRFNYKHFIIQTKFTSDSIRNNRFYRRKCSSFYRIDQRTRNTRLLEIARTRVLYPHWMMPFPRGSAGPLLQVSFHFEWSSNTSLGLLNNEGEKIFIFIGAFEGSPMWREKETWFQCESSWRKNPTLGLSLFHI